MTKLIGEELKALIGSQVDIWLKDISKPVHGRLIKYKLDGPPTIVLEVENKMEGREGRVLFYTRVHSIIAFTVFFSREELDKWGKDAEGGKSSPNTE